MAISAFSFLYLVNCHVILRNASPMHLYSSMKIGISSDSLFFNLFDFLHASFGLKTFTCIHFFSHLQSLGKNTSLSTSLIFFLINEVMSKEAFVVGISVKTVSPFLGF